MEDANLPAARRDRRESGTHMRYGVETSAQNRPTSRARKMCRVPNCPHADLTNAPRYCIRHSICELHIKAMEVMFNNKPYRFCQKCTRFHEKHDFEADRHTCRERLQEQREKRMANMLARRSKLAAADGGAEQAPGLRSFAMPELPSFGYAVGSKRAAPQMNDSLLMQLNNESKFGSSVGAGFCGMAEFTNQSKLGMPTGIDMNLTSELLAQCNTACRRRVDPAELGAAPSVNNALAGSIPLAGSTPLAGSNLLADNNLLAGNHSLFEALLPRAMANMATTPAGVLQLVNMLQHQGQAINGGLPLFSMEPMANLAQMLLRSPEAAMPQLPDQSFAAPTPAPALAIDFPPARQGSADNTWPSSSLLWPQNASSLM